MAVRLHQFSFLGHLWSKWFILYSWSVIARNKALSERAFITKWQCYSSPGSNLLSVNGRGVWQKFGDQVTWHGFDSHNEQFPFSNWIGLDDSSSYNFTKQVPPRWWKECGVDNMWNGGGNAALFVATFWTFGDFLRKFSRPLTSPQKCVKKIAPPCKKATKRITCGGLILAVLRVCL